MKISMWKICLVCLFGIFCAQCLAAPETLSIEKCGAFPNFSSSTYIDIAVKLQSLPKESAINQLKVWANTGYYEFPVIVLCRMLFEPKDSIPLRHPRIGRAAFYGSTKASLHFSLEPICIVDGVPFLVVKSYILGGAPEKASEYLAYCVESGNWGAFQFKRVNTEELENAYNHLIRYYLNNQVLDKSDSDSLHKQIEP